MSPEATAPSNDCISCSSHPGHYHLENKTVQQMPSIKQTWSCTRMTACQIGFKVKSHRSCMGSEPCHIPALWEKPHFMQRMQPALSSTPPQHNLKNGPWAQAVDRQTAPAKAGHCFKRPIPQHKGRTCILQVANINDALGPQGVLTRQQQAQSDQFIQPGTCLLCNPIVSWHRLECNFGRTCWAGELWLSSLQEFTLYPKNTQLGWTNCQYPRIYCYATQLKQQGTFPVRLHLLSSFLQATFWTCLIQ